MIKSLGLGDFKFSVRFRHATAAAALFASQVKTLDIQISLDIGEKASIGLETVMDGLSETFCQDHYRGTY